MTRDPRAPCESPRSMYEWGADDRLAALLPQLEAADALAEALCSTPIYLGVKVEVALAAFLSARDAHLTEGTPQ